VPLAAAGVLLAAPVATWAVAHAYGRRAHRLPCGAGSDAIVVFGAGLMRWGPRSGLPTPLLQARLDRATELFAGGAAPRVVCAGGQEEVVAMRTALEQAGIPAAAIELDQHGLNTELTLANASAGAARLAAVTSRSHALRVRLEARRQRLDVAVCAAGPTRARGPLRWQVREALREVVALWWYAARALAGR
jgi:vancomycin permeability regulator SanA